MRHDCLAIPATSMNKSRVSTAPLTRIPNCHAMRKIESKRKFKDSCGHANLTATQEAGFDDRKQRNSVEQPEQIEKIQIMHCKACIHRDRAEIDAQMVANIPYRAISSRFAVPLGTLSRHAHHVREMIKERLPHERAEHGTNLISRVETIITEAEGILESAKSTKDLRCAILALGAIGKQLETLARMTGGLIRLEV